MSQLCRTLCSLGIILCFALFPVRSAGQNSAARPSFPQPDLKQLVQQSGFIFAGTVTKIETAPAKTGPVAAVRITFRVEQAILGVREGESLEVREWAGVWNFGERYRVGERVVLFLYPPSRLGLTSPVGGAFGHFSLTSDRQVRLDRTRTEAIPSPRAIDRTQPVTQIPAGEFVRAIRSEVAEQRRGREIR